MEHGRKYWMNKSNWPPETKRAKKNTTSVVFFVYIWLSRSPLDTSGWRTLKKKKKEAHLRYEIDGARKIEREGTREKISSSGKY